MLFSNLELSRRLECAEGYACAQFALARQRVSPDRGSIVLECAGAYAVFDGVGSPTTQSFGLGLFEELTVETLETIERFYVERGAEVHLEISPLVGLAALALLCERGYRPLEISSVMYRSVENSPGNPAARVIGPEEASVWAETGAKAWAHEHPELKEFLLETGEVFTERHGSTCFLAEIDGQPAAAGALSIHEGVALFAGSATVAEFRRRGMQAALLEERMRYAYQQGCDLAMMVAEAGSNSQRNAERQGFRVAYTRIKWQAARPA